MCVCACVRACLGVWVFEAVRKMHVTIIMGNWHRVRDECGRVDGNGGGCIIRCVDVVVAAEAFGVVVEFVFVAVVAAALSWYCCDHCAIGVIEIFGLCCIPADTTVCF